MSFLLDTNVVSEWMKPRPNPGVIAWLAEVDEDRTFLSVITLTELRYEIERMAAGNRRKRLQEWLEEELPLRFEGRILPIDSTVADVCGTVVARSEAVGRRMEVMDAFLAATAEIHRLTVVTRNASDFQPVVRSVLNPWTWGFCLCAASYTDSPFRLCYAFPIPANRPIRTHDESASTGALLSVACRDVLGTRDAHLGTD